MRYKKCMILLGICLVNLLGIVGIYAGFADEITLVNHLSSGDVNIELEEYQLRNGKEVRYQAPKTVLPGEEISKIPRIRNKGFPCWIRARIYFSENTGQTEGLSSENLSDFPKEWIKRGEYYYYTQILPPQKTADLFQKVTIPSHWEEEHMEQQLGLTIRAEAIQAANFQPDFSSSEPWGGQTAEVCIHKSSGSASCKFQPAKLSVEFHGGANRLLAVPKDFFINMGTLMPGDIHKDTAVLSNTSDHPVTLYFRTETPDAGEKQKEFLQKLQIYIFVKDKTIYQGSLYGEVKKSVSLGTFDPGAKESLSFVISAPKDMQNKYSLLEGTVKWIFAVKQDASSPGDPHPPNEAFPSEKGEGTPAKSAKTADKNPLFWYAVVLLGSFLLAVRTAIRLGKEATK